MESTEKEPRNDDWSDESVANYQDRMYGPVHMQEYLRFRSETLGSLVRDCPNTAPKILEVACGPGLSQRYLHNAFKGTPHMLAGVDISPAMLRLARRNATEADANALLARAAAHRLPFADETFDVVFATRFLHMFRDRFPVVEELRRVARRPGLVVLELYSRPPNAVRWVVQGRRKPWAEFGYHFPTLSEVKKLVGPKADFLPLRFGGARVIRAVVGDARVRGLLSRAWHSPLRIAVDEYLAVIRLQ